MILNLQYLKSQASDKIAFAYEMIRHGARAPGNDDPGEFKVPK